MGVGGMRGCRFRGGVTWFADIGDLVSSEQHVSRGKAENVC